MDIWTSNPNYQEQKHINMINMTVPEFVHQQSLMPGRICIRLIRDTLKELLVLDFVMLEEGRSRHWQKNWLLIISISSTDLKLMILEVWNFDNNWLIFNRINIYVYAYAFLDLIPGDIKWKWNNDKLKWTISLFMKMNFAAEFLS